MTQLSFNSVDDANHTLLCGLTPSGRIDVHAGSPDHGPGISAETLMRIVDAFEFGRGQGVLHPGAGELGTELHPTLSYWREIGQSFVAGVCGALDPTDGRSLVVPDPVLDDLEAFVQAAPPMRGAELINVTLLGEIWSDLGEALSIEASKCKDGVQGYLKKQSSVWNVVGRVCFHLAENKRDPSYPSRVGRFGRHLPPPLLDGPGGSPVPVPDCTVRAGRRGRAHAGLVEPKRPSAPQCIDHGRRNAALSSGHGRAPRLRCAADPWRTQADQRGDQDAARGQ